MFLGCVFVSNIINSKKQLDRVLFTATLNGGIAGTIGIGAIMLYLTTVLGLPNRSKEGCPLAVAVIASLAGFLTCGVTDYVLYGSKYSAILHDASGSCACSKKIYTKKTADSETPETELPAMQQAD